MIIIGETNLLGGHIFAQDANATYIDQSVKSPTLFVTTDRNFEKPEIINYAKDYEVEIVFSTGEVIDRYYKELEDEKYATYYFSFS